MPGQITDKVVLWIFGDPGTGRCGEGIYPPGGWSGSGLICIEFLGTKVPRRDCSLMHKSPWKGAAKIPTSPQISTLSISHLMRKQIFKEEMKFKL